MILKKNDVLNHFFKSTGLKIFTFLLLAVLLSFFHSFAQGRLVKIELPQKVAGVEKLEYLINGQPRGNTAGITSLNLYEGTKLNFLLKFNSKSYTQLKCEDVKIKSESGEDLSLCIYKYDSQDELIISEIPSGTTIDPNQTYVTSTIEVSKDEKFKITGVVADQYPIVINLESPPEGTRINEALEISYKINGIGEEIPAHVDENGILQGITLSDEIYGLDLYIKPTKPYSKSKLLLNNYTESPDPIWVIKGYSDITVKGLQKDTFDLQTFLYLNPMWNNISLNIRVNNNDFTKETFKNLKLNIEYGDNCDFKFLDDNIYLKNFKVLANNVIIRPDKEKVYHLKNISENITLEIKSSGSDNGLYPISFEALEGIAKVTDTNGNVIPSNTNANNYFQFKLSINPAYTQSEANIKIYAQSLEYSNDELTSDKAEQLFPSNGIYTISLRREPIAVFPKGEEKNKYKVTLPENLEGAAYEVLENENVKKISENQFSIVHGEDLILSLTANQGYDISKSEITSYNKNITANREENIFIISNITEDTELLIEGTEKANYSVTFDAPGFICFDEFGTKLPSNVSIKGGSSQEFKFQIGLTPGYKIAEDGIKLEPADLVKAVPEEEGFYTISEVYEDTTIHITGSESTTLNVKVRLPEEGNFELKDNYNDKVLPQEFSIEYGSKFEFKVYDKDDDTNSKNLVAISSGNATIERISTDPCTFSINNIKEDIIIFISIVPGDPNPSKPSNPEITNYYLAKKFKIVNKNADILTAKFSKEPNQTSKYFSYTDDTTFQLNPTYHTGILGPNSEGEGAYFELTKQSEEYPILDCKFSIYSDKEISKKIDALDSIKADLPSNLSEDGKTGNKVFYFGTIEKGNDKPVFLESIYNASEEKYEGIGYLYEEVYILVEPKPIDNYEIKFPQLPGIKFYNIKEVNLEDSPGFLPVNEEDEIYSVVSGSQISDAVQSNKESFDFKYELEEGYEIEGIEVTPEGQASLKQYRVISSDKKNKFTFQIYDVYSSSIKIKLNLLKKKEYSIDFSDSIGTDFSTDAGGKDKIASKAIVSHGDSFKFYANPQEKYKEDIKEFIVEIGSQKHIVQTSATEKMNFGTLAQFFPSSDSTGKKVYEFSNVKTNIKVSVIREEKKLNVTFPKVDNLTFRDLNNEKIYSEEQTVEILYGKDLSFTINAAEGYDTSKIVILANQEEIPIKNGMYVIEKIKEDKKIEVQNLLSSRNKIVFTPYEELVYKNSSGQDIEDLTLEVEYGKSVQFSIDLKESFSNSKIKVNAESSSQQGLTELQYDPITKLYTLENIKESYRIYVDGIELNSHTIKFTKSDEIKYYNQYGAEALVSEDSSQKDFITKNIKDGENFSFKILPEEGRDISQLEVWIKPTNSNKNPTRLEKFKEIYTVENVKEDFTVYTANVQSVQYNVEIRTTEGVKCLDNYGHDFPSNLTVRHGESISFSISLDGAYSNSKPIVSIKGSLNTLSPDAEGVYILENITENKIIEINNVIKNSYRVTFKPAEGVIYKTIKGKTFEDYLDVEYGNALQFVVSLMNAYDSSTPRVLLNNVDAVAGNNGVYTIQNVSSNMEISVENVVKNPEELTMEKIVSVPNAVSSSSDVNEVISATRAYNNLSDENKALITNLDELKSAQEKSEAINHSSENVTVTGIDWNIKLVVTSLNDNSEAIEKLNAEIERKSLITLYEMKLYNLLTNEEYKVPYGQEVSVTMPCPDLTGFENPVIVHKNSAGGIEYLSANISSGVVQFNTSSFSQFGMAAKKIPNFSENPSDLKVSVANLVDSEDQLQSLLGEGVTSQIGELINTEDTSSGSKSDLSPSEEETNPDATSHTLFSKVYNWAINNELLAVILILILGSITIILILLLNRKKSEE